MFRIYHFDHTAYHLLSSKEIGNHAVAKRSDRTNILVRLPVHLACLFSDSQHLVGTPVEGNYRWLIYYDLTTTDDDGIRSTQVHRYFLCKRK